MLAWAGESGSIDHVFGLVVVVVAVDAAAAVAAFAAVGKTDPAWHVSQCLYHTSSYNTLST